MAELSDYTRKVIDEMDYDELGIFIIRPKAPKYERPDVKVSDFADRREYRQYLINERRKFNQAHHKDFLDYCSKQNIQLKNYGGVLSCYIAELSKEQVKTLSEEDGLVKTIVADQEVI